MKIIAKLSMKQVEELVTKGKLSDVCVIPINKTLQGLIRQYLEENTGFDFKPVMALGRVQGQEGLSEVWYKLDSLISLEEGDIVVEFDMPDDMVATISYEEFLAMNNKREYLPDEVSDSLCLEEHSADENEFAFLPCLMFKYCTGYQQVGPNWESESYSFNSPSNLNQILHFNK